MIATPTSTARDYRAYDGKCISCKSDPENGVLQYGPDNVRNLCNKCKRFFRTHGILRYNVNQEDVSDAAGSDPQRKLSISNISPESLRQLRPREESATPSESGADIHHLDYTTDGSGIDEESAGTKTTSANGRRLTRLQKQARNELSRLTYDSNFRPAEYSRNERKLRTHLRPSIPRPNSGSHANRHHANQAIDGSKPPLRVNLARKVVLRTPTGQERPPFEVLGIGEFAKPASQLNYNKILEDTIVFLDFMDDRMRERQARKRVRNPHT